MTTFHGFEFLATILSKRAQQLWDSWIVYGWTRLAKHIPSKNLALFPQTCRNNLGVSTLFPPAFTSFAEFSTVVIDECFFFFPMADFFFVWYPKMKYRCSEDIGKKNKGIFAFLRLCICRLWFTILSFLSYSFHFLKMFTLAQR